MTFVRNGVSKLPPGFRFEPTDDEIIFQYLSRKIFRHPLPAHIMPEIHAFAFPPWQLLGEESSEKYYFSKKGGKNEDGVWKGMNTIICSKRFPILGIKKTLVFYKFDGCSNGAVRTDWMMHQFCIATYINNFETSLIRIGEWSLCRIFSEKCKISRLQVGGTSDDESDDYMSDTDSSSSSTSSSN